MKLCLAATCTVEIMPSCCGSMLWSHTWSLVHHSCVAQSATPRFLPRLTTLTAEGWWDVDIAWMCFLKWSQLLEQSLCLYQKETTVHFYTPPTNTNQHLTPGNAQLLPMTTSTRLSPTTHSPDTGSVPAHGHDRLSNPTHCRVVCSVPLQAHCFSCFPLPVSVLSWLLSYIDFRWNYWAVNIWPPPLLNHTGHVCLAQPLPEAGGRWVCMKK